MMTPQPNPASVTAFVEFVELVKGTMIHLVFDYKWLPEANQAAIQRLIKGKVSLDGCSLNKFYSKNWELKDWTHFAPTAAPALLPESTNKRARPVSRSISPPPPAKRATLDNSDAPSPTEVASSPPDYAKADPDSDFQTQAITRVVTRELPAIVSTVLPAVLTTILPQQMPHLMPLLFVDQPSHTNSFDSDASSFPQLQLTTIGAALIPPLLQHLKPQLQAIEDRALSRTRAQREHAALKFQEDVENTKWELDEVIEKGKQDLETEKGYKLDDLRHELREEGDDIAVDVADQVRWAADDVVDGTLKRLKDIDRQALGKLVEWELAQPLGRRKDCQCRNESGLRG
ncbi:hypothetical protein N0V86_004265 [Didymella sp. IMI 355093]|nr:hypothetical protein N0V86_004265 [Didymella sp. IMI 355093]